jgi:long-chain fatty acid transport protein
MRTLKIALTLLLPAVALANGYDVPNTNPRDLAMAGSLTAAQRDAAAAYANPAALSKLEGLNLNGAIGFLDLSTKWTGPDTGALAGQSASTKRKPVPPPSLFAAYGFKLADRNAGVGLGMNIPGGGNVDYAADWPGRGRIITVDRKVYGFYLTGGYEVLSQLRFGGGLVYYYGTEYLKQGVQPSDASYGELSTKGGAFSFDLAADYTLPEIPLSFGIDFKYKATMKLSGNGKFVVPTGLLTAVPAPVDQGVKHDLTYPSVLNLAASYRVMKPWLLTAGFTWNGYSVYGSDVFTGDAGTTIKVQRDYKDGYTFRLGSEYDLNPKIQLRAGILRDISGLDTDFYSATLPVSNAWAGSLGAGWEIQRDLSVQAAFFYAWLDRVTVTGTTELPGSYKTGVWIASAGVVWRTDLGGGQ